MPFNTERNPDGRVPRVEPVNPPYDDDTAGALNSLGPPLMLFREFARRPDRARGVFGWGSYYLSRRSGLSLRHRELVIDRTTAMCGAEYEWAIHIAAFADKAELTTAQIYSMTHGKPTDGCWTDPADRAVLAAVDGLHAQADLDDEQWSNLVGAIGEDAAIDLLLLAGWYHAISYAANALRLPLEPNTVGFPPV